ncbi:baseplate hub subunit [Synechococcus phage BUCT-ZZ01]|nr:baseplate hub subunit [Synechococcus phage BUCT-ZZ01]
MMGNCYYGIVENRMDPLEMGRCQVRIFGVHSESKVDVPTEDLPWAIPLMPLTSASMSGIGHSPTGPIEGTMVMVTFQDPESKQIPVMLGTVPAIPKNRALGGEFATSDIPNLDFAGDTNETVLTDNQGNPVLDGEGNPVSTGEPEPKEPLIVTPNNGKVSGELNINGYVRKYGEIAKTLKDECLRVGIQNPYTINAIMANVVKESQFKPREENLNYTSAARLRAVFPSFFRNNTDEELAIYIRNPKQLADKIYGGREGNLQDEGFEYRGRGFIQLTFKNNYRSVGSRIGVDLVSNPDKMLDPLIAVQASVQFFLNNAKLNVLNAYTTQAEALKAITRIIVGKNVDFSSGIGAEQYQKVVQASALGIVETAIATVNDPLQGTSSQALTEKKSTEIGNPGANAAGVVLSPVTGSGDSGFADPNGIYPRYFNEQDTNRLARGEKLNLTIVPEKEKFLRAMKNIPKANGKGTWNAPENPYNASYPYNHVYESESGHVMEFDDTPQNERVHVYHKSGSYFEIDPNGSRVNRIVGDNYEIWERDGYIKVFGNVVIHVDGDANVVVNNNCDLKVDGDLTADIGNDLITRVSGSASVSVAEQAYVKAEEIRIESYSANVEILSSSNLNLSSAGSLNIKSASTLNLQAAGDVNIKAGGNNNFEAAGNANYVSGGNTAIQSSRLDFNNGASGAATAADATGSGLEVPEPRLKVDPVEFDTLTLPPKNFEALSEFEESTAPNSYTFELQRKGLIDDDPIPGVVGEKEKVIAASIPGVGVGCDIFINQENIPVTLQLSPTVKLIDLCKSSSGGGSIIPQVGLTEGQIVCNLKHLAVNVIEPVKAKYNVIITSAFRRGNGKSQHNKGQAVDFVFSGKTPAQVIEIAKDLAKSIPFDQMILEYLPKKRVNGMPTTWLHISYRSDGNNRKQIFTMSDHAVLANSINSGELILVT